MMTVSLADVLRGRECKNKAEDHAKGPIRGKLPVILFTSVRYSQPELRSLGDGKPSRIEDLV